MNEIILLLFSNNLPERDLVLIITAQWKKGFVCFVNNPSFSYKLKTYKTTKINDIRTQIIEEKSTFDIEIYVVKCQSEKRDVDGERKNNFFLIGDTSGLIWLRTRFDLDDKQWYIINGIKTLKWNEDIILFTNHTSIKLKLERNDVRTFLHILHCE